MEKIYCARCTHYWVYEDAMGCADDCCGIKEVFSSPTDPPRLIKGLTNCNEKNKNNDCSDFVKRPWWKFWR